MSAPCIALLITTSAVSAAELVTSWVTVADGLPTSWTTAVDEDPTGFVWIGGPGWISRYDGEHLRTWEIPRPVALGVVQIVALSTERVVFRLVDDEVLVLQHDGIRPLVGPDGAPLRAPSIDRGRFATLLTAHNGVGVRWSPELDEWEVVTPPAVSRVQHVDDGQPGEILYATKHGWFAWDGGVVRELLETSHAVDAAADGEAIWLMASDPLRVWRLEGEGAPVLHLESTSHHAYSLALRHDAAWFTDAGAVVRLGADGSMTRYENNGGLVRGPLVVDAAGSVWAVSYSGLLYAPDPGLERWTTGSGLPANAVHTVVRFTDEMWVGSWDGLHRVTANGVAQRGDDRLSKARPCLDGHGNLWYKVADGEAIGWVTRFVDGKVRTLPFGGPHSAPTKCAADPDGYVWLLDGEDLYRAPPGGEPTRVGRLPDRMPRFYPRLLITRDRWLWTASAPQVCGAPLDAILGGEVDWQCWKVEPGGLSISWLHETERGHIWAIQRDARPQVLGPRGFEEVPGADALDIDDMRYVAPSPRGGQWLVGIGAVARVLDDPRGLRVVEEVPSWVGRMVAPIEGAYEDRNGDLWLASSTGLVKLPEVMRGRPRPPPTVRRVATLVDGVEASDPVVMGPGEALTLEVSAIAFRAPRLVRYRHRVDGGPWSRPVAGGSLSFAGLSAGHHRLQVESSLDGQDWSDPLQVAVEVVAPWWRRGEVWAALGGLGLLLFQLGQVTRLRLQARAQALRTRVAMDLHDELGAGLASMGLLAGLIASEKAGARTVELAGRIASDAGQLGAGLSGIVWSLRDGHNNLGALVDYLHHRSHVLLPEGIEVECSAALRATRVDLDVLRALQLVGLEAITNAARHADATRVHLSVRRQGRDLCLCIADDGVGLTGRPAGPDRGLGLRSMERRVASIGGTFDLISRPGRGVEISVAFAPRRPWWSWRS